ncbi:MAG TPA: ATP-binding protein [Pyrinomonadaceae bacterium]|nr:ATP-binding protein [Pyrinomonadaceae bacterium]
MNPQIWQDGNSHYLSASLKWLRLRLERLAQQSGATAAAVPSPTPDASLATPEPPSVVAPAAKSPRRLRWIGRPSAPPSASTSDAPPLALLLPVADIEEQLRQAETERAEAAKTDPPPALVMLGMQLGLSEFELELLLLCVAMELDTSVEGWCARAQNDKTRTYPTFALALSLFDAPSWDALSPHRPLRYWRLLEVNQSASLPLTASPLRADERIVSYVKGLNSLDDRLAAMLAPVTLPATDAFDDAPAMLAPSQRQAVEAILWHWRFTPPSAALPLVELSGADAASKRLVAHAAASAFNRQLFSVGAEALTAQAAELDSLARLWQRETMLLPLALYLDAHDAAPPDRFLSGVARSNGLVLLGVRDPLPNVGETAFTVDVSKPTTAEQEGAWRDALADLLPAHDDEVDSPPGSPPVAAEADGYAGRLASQFSFNLPDIYNIGESARAAVHSSGQAAGRGTDATQKNDVWELCKARTRQRLDVLAERLEPKAKWEDIVLGEEAERLLRTVADQVRLRNTVYEQWGFARKMNRGFGISALFAGESGTGKTMAAEVIANDLRLNLYRIDLSAVVSKYIGETEKNLRRLFDAAENGGTILFFDEADALFGKRSEVKDSHDRYANIEINYLLQRMEGYGGLAILATNMKSALDQAFMRRLRFIVNFTFPGASERKQMWEKAFPPELPKEALDYDRLARFSLTGGNIHNIALNAAFLAAQGNSPVTMPLVMSAARMEFRKLDRALNESDFRV